VRIALITVLLVLLLAIPTMAIDVNVEKGYIEIDNVFNEAKGYIKAIDKRVPDGCVLWFDFSPDNIYYNETEGYYYIKDLSGNGNDGKIYGLTNNVLANATVITVNTQGEHLIEFPYYNNVTSASLTVYWNATNSPSDVQVNVSLNGNLLGSFVASAGTTGSYTFSGIENYIAVNATNTISYESNASIDIEKAQFDYDHDLTLVETENGWALYFDGVNDYIEVPDNPSLQFGTSDFSIFGWFNIKTIGASQQLICRRTVPGSAGDFEIQVTSTNYITATIGGDGSITSGSSTTVVTTTNWYFTGFTRKNGVVTLYVNATAECTFSASYNVSTTESLTIGKDNIYTGSDAEYLKGFIAHISIYNYAVAQEYIKLLNALLQNNYRNSVELDEEVQMRIDSVTFDGSNYTITVNITLPADGYEHLIYLPSSAQHSYAKIASVKSANGYNFDIVDVGSASYAKFNITIPADLTVPNGVNLTVYRLNDKIYVVTSRNEDFKITNVTGIWTNAWNNITDVGTTLYLTNTTTKVLAKTSAIIVDPETWCNLTVDTISRTYVKFKADAPTSDEVKFTITNLIPGRVYHLYVDGVQMKTAKVLADGKFEFTVTNWSEHTFEIAVGSYFENIGYFILLNYPALITLIIIVSAGMIMIGVFMGRQEGEGATAVNIATAILIAGVMGVILALIILVASLFT